MKPLFHGKYTKNDNMSKQAAKTKVRAKVIDKEITKTQNKETNDETENDQRKITEYFIKNIRKEIETIQNDEDNNSIEVTNTQEFINDARERRILALNGKSKVMSCEQCEFKSSSKTLLTKHMDDTHQNENI